MSSSEQIIKNESEKLEETSENLTPTHNQISHENSDENIPTPPQSQTQNYPSQHELEPITIYPPCIQIIENYDNFTSNADNFNNGESYCTCPNCAHYYNQEIYSFLPLKRKKFKKVRRNKYGKVASTSAVLNSAHPSTPLTCFAVSSYEEHLYKCQQVLNERDEPFGFFA